MKITMIKPIRQLIATRSTPAAILCCLLTIGAVSASSAGGFFGAAPRKLAEQLWNGIRLAYEERETEGSRTRPLIPSRASARQEKSPAIAPLLQSSLRGTTMGPSRTLSGSSQPRLVQLPSASRYVDVSSAAFARFKTWVDNAVNGNRGYGFAASEAVLMFQITPEQKYCTLAVTMVEKQVTDAETAIASGTNPRVAGDSYLEVGSMISDLSVTLQTCASFITQSQRTRWSAYAEQTIWNVWNFGRARWGGRSAPWTGWSVDNPGNNYHYSFLEATMHWAIVSKSAVWMEELQARRLPALQAYYAALPGGGSREGTGYGTAQMRLFSLYRLWRDATGVDLANSNTHSRDSILYWINATVPTLDRFAPIGDQSRSSVPELYDYHRRLVLEARQVTSNEIAQRAATWWLSSISVGRMTSGFNYRYDLIPAGNIATQPTDLMYHAKGAGHLFARSGWDSNAMWIAVVAGPYTESHAHQDQGSFTLFARDWLAVTANIWSHSGINQATDVHNVVRFVRDGSTVRQCTSTTRSSTLVVTPGAGGAFVANANLTPAFCNNTAVASWNREFSFGGRKLVVRDSFNITSGTSATFQVNAPVLPVLVNNREAVAGRLRVRVLEPANAVINPNFSTGKYSGDGKRYRIDVEGGVAGYLVELSEL